MHIDRLKDDGMLSMYKLWKVKKLWVFTHVSHLFKNHRFTRRIDSFLLNSNKLYLIAWFDGPVVIYGISTHLRISFPPFYYAHGYRDAAAIIEIHFNTSCRCVLESCNESTCDDEMKQWPNLLQKLVFKWSVFMALQNDFSFSIR